MKISFLLWLASLLPQPQADHLCLATTVYLEARDQPVLGQKAVAEVALRRQSVSPRGTSLCAVVQEPGQFALTYVKPGYTLDDSDALARSFKVAGEAMRSWESPLPKRGFVVPGARYFAAIGTLGGPPSWAHGEPVATIGDHSFYR